jgi:hypothetical protein
MKNVAEGIKTKYYQFKNRKAIAAEQREREES